MAQLNRAQLEAVEHGDGPLLILAGAGSGKTRVITHRIARILQSGVAPERVLAVSFTNKAAEEMRERMVPLVGKKAASQLWMSTFHSFGLRFVREQSEELGLGKRFVIFDQGDSLGVVKQIMRELHDSGAIRKLDPMAILARISSWKNRNLGPEAVPEAVAEYDDVAREVYPQYVARLLAMRAVDFDDLCTWPVHLLSRDGGLRQRWQRRFEHVLVDEFQDTSRVQLELVKLLVNDRGNCCVVGDDDQSIYAFRGAEVGNILDFERHFEGTRVVKLEDNYRSRPAILEVANAAIKKSAGRRHEKTLRAARPPGEPVWLCVGEDPLEETKVVIAEMRKLLKEGVRYEQMAVLYRSNLQARVLEEELRAEGLPYRLFGGTQFFDRKEIKDVAAYLRLLLNRRDEISLRRILNYPTRGIGTKTIERLDLEAAQSSRPLWRLIDDVGSVSGLGEPAQRSVQAFSELIERYRRRFAEEGRLTAVARALVAELSLREELTAAAGDKGGAQRWGNVEHLMGWLERFERESGPGGRSLSAFLESVTLGIERNEVEAEDAIVLSTLHASKGLEFDVVFLIGCVEGQLPHARVVDPKVTEANPTDVEEERRLFYVGVTRARDRLYLCRPRRRLVRGKPEKLTPSRFLEGLPEAHMAEYQSPVAEKLDFDELEALGDALLEQLRSRNKER